MKHKQIAALIGMALLLIAVSSTALAVNSMWCNNCDKFVEFTSLGFRKIDETAHAVVVKCNECGTEKWASTGPHVGGTATCAQKAVCRGCGAEYGEKLSYHKNTVLIQCFTHTRCLPARKAVGIAILAAWIADTPPRKRSAHWGMTMAAGHQMAMVRIRTPAATMGAIRRQCAAAAAQQAAAPKRSVRSSVRNTAKQTRITTL